LPHFQEARAVNFGGAFVRTDDQGRRAVIPLPVDLAPGKTGLTELR
jgi:hypothetical protein